MSIETGMPRDLLAAHPETAYFWGRVLGDGDVTAACVTVRTGDETAARRVAAIAGAEQVDHRICKREYAHDTSITRTEDEYTVQVFGQLGERASAAFGLPLDGATGGYRLDALGDHWRQLLRGLLEGSGTVCFKSSEGTVGVSFVQEDRELLESIQSILAEIPPEASTGEIADSSSGGYWFSIADEDTPAVAAWLYDGSDASGLFSPERRRKVTRSLEQATAYDVDIPWKDT